MDVSMMSRVKELEAENVRPKKMYAVAQLQANVLKKSCKKVARPSRRREMAGQEVKSGRMSTRLVCDTFVIS